MEQNGGKGESLGGGDERKQCGGLVREQCLLG